MLGTPSKVESDFAGEHFELEVEADPQNHLQERTRTNNEASASYDIPMWEEASFCDRVRDCRDYPTGDEKQNRICERYAGYYCNEVDGTANWCDNYPDRVVGGSSP